MRIEKVEYIDNIANCFALNHRFDSKIFDFTIFFQVTIVNAQKDNETIVFGPIDGGKSVVIVGDHSKHIWVKGII